MPLPKGAYYRIKTYPSGKKVRLGVSAEGKILESTPIGLKQKRSKTRGYKRLEKRKRRIAR